MRWWYLVEYHTNSYAKISNSSQKNDQMKKMVQVRSSRQIQAAWMNNDGSIQQHGRLGSTKQEAVVILHHGGGGYNTSTSKAEAANNVHQ